MKKHLLAAIASAQIALGSGISTIMVCAIFIILKPPINHIAAVVLPAVGGMLWVIDYRIPFIFGAFLSLISLMLVQQIKVK